VSSHCRAVLLSALVVVSSLACAQRDDHGSSSGEGSAANHPLVVRFFDGCQRHDPELLERTLARASLSQLDRLFVGDGGTRRSRLLKVAGILARVPVPQCKAGEKTEVGYRLSCQNLGRELTFEVIGEGKGERLLLPAVPEELFSRLGESLPDR
jgi:hypothetical protein